MTAFNVPPLKNMEVSLNCRACGQTMKAMLDMPQDFFADTLTLNVSWCPFDTEQGRKDLYKGLSIAERKNGGSKR